MDYYKLLGLHKEPFSNSPDPEFFYRAEEHVQCLQNLEIAIRLRRGLCLVRGEVGTGKTTLCRQLIRNLDQESDLQLHLILDPSFERALDLAAELHAMLAGTHEARSFSSLAGHKEGIKNHLFQIGSEQGTNVALIIDEGQKLSPECVEFLRELLNFETNEHKLLQIVIFAQNEIQDLLDRHPNFTDRIALEQRLGPLSRQNTARLIRYRLQKAGAFGPQASAPVFSTGSWERIYRITRGYPRKIIHLGQHILLIMLIQGKQKITPGIIQQAAANVPGINHKQRSWLKPFSAGIGSALLVLLFLGLLYGVPGWSWMDMGAEESPTRDVTAPQVKDIPGLFPELEVLVREKSQDPPEELGRVRITKGDNLWIMLERIYGRSYPQLLDLLLEANPEVQDPALVSAGQSLVFPALESSPPGENRKYWLQYEKFQDLDEAHLSVLEQKDIDLRVLSYWEPDLGLRHAVVHPEPFSSRQKAETTLQNLDPQQREKTSILDLSRKEVRLLTP